MAEEIIITLVSDVVIYINDSSLEPASAIPNEVDPTVPVWVKAITQDDIDNWNNAGGGGLTCETIGDCPTIQAIENDVDQEEAARIAGDEGLQLQANSLFFTQGNHTSQINQLIADLLQETTVRETADTILANQFSSHESDQNNPHNTTLNQVAQADNQLSTNIDMQGAAKILNLPTPTLGGDAATKDYVDAQITAAASEITVANIAARNALNITLGYHVFVQNDGDGNWALYKAITAGVNATYVKLSDPDLLNAAMSASAIKSAYESNANTNAYTDAEKAKLAGISAGATANDTDANLKNRANHTGTQDASTITGTKTSSFISDFSSAVNSLIASASIAASQITGTKTSSFISDFAATVRSTVLTGLDLTTNAVISASDSVLSALGKLQKQITDISANLKTKAIYNLHFGCAEISPADATTYYFGHPVAQPPSTTAQRRKILVTTSGTIKKFYMTALVRSSAGTAETVTFNIKINNGTAIPITTTAVFNVNTPIDITNNALSSAVTEGQYIEIEMVCPTWVTNPTNISFSGHITIEQTLT